MDHILKSVDERTATEQIAVQAPYTSVQLAGMLGVSEATIRNRWFVWIAKVAPEPLLREGKGYSELARSLFVEFSQIPKNSRERWAEEARARYSQEWSNAGVIDAEWMPDEVGNALAVIDSNNRSLSSLLEQELQSLDLFLEQVDGVEADFSEAELQSFRLTGAKRAVQRFKVETQAELETLNQLRQKRIQGKP